MKTHSLFIVAGLFMACAPQASRSPTSNNDLASPARPVASASTPEPSPPAPGEGKGPVSQAPLFRSVAQLGARLAPLLASSQSEQKQAIPRDNLAFSPLGIHAILSVLASGAGEPSQRAFAELLGASLDESWATSYQQLLTQLAQHEGISLQTRLDVAREQQPDPVWVTTLERDFQTAFASQDFMNDARGATVRIDAWFRETTKGRIPSVYHPLVLPRTSALVASSSLTFARDWSHRFSLLETAPRLFVLASGEKVSVPMMRAEKMRAWVGRVDAQAEAVSPGVGVAGPLFVALPFVGDETFLLLGLPVSTQDLPHLEQQLSDPGVPEILARMDFGEHEILLPKIDWLTPSFSLSQALSQLEGGQVLSQLDLSRAGLSGPFNLSSLVQRVAVRWDEKGADLVAATSGAAVGIGLATVKPIALDHPFVFAVVQRQTGLILFQGRVLDPRSFGR